MTRTRWLGLVACAIGLLGSAVDPASANQHGSTQTTLLTRPVNTALAGAIQRLMAWESAVKPNASTVRRCPTGHEVMYVVGGQLRFAQYPSEQGDLGGEVTPGGYIISAAKSGAIHLSPGAPWTGVNDGTEDAKVLTVGLCETNTPLSTTDAILDSRQIDLRGLAMNSEIRVWEATIAKDNSLVNQPPSPQSTTGRHCHVGDETTYLVKGRLRYHAQYQARPGDRPVESPPNAPGAVLTPGKIVHLEPGKIHEGNNQRAADDPLLGMQDAVVLMVSIYPKGSPPRVPPRGLPLSNPTAAAEFAQKCHD